MLTEPLVCPWKPDEYLSSCKGRGLEIDSCSQWGRLLSAGGESPVSGGVGKRMTSLREARLRTLAGHLASDSRAPGSLISGLLCCVCQLCVHTCLPTPVNE